MDHKKWLPCKVETASSLKNEHVGYMFLSKDLIKSVQTDSPLYSVYRLVERWWRAISLYFFSRSGIMGTWSNIRRSRL